MIQIGTRVIIREKSGFWAGCDVCGEVGVIEDVTFSKNSPVFKIFVETAHTTLYNCDESDFEVIVE